MLQSSGRNILTAYQPLPEWIAWKCNADSKGIHGDSNNPAVHDEATQMNKVLVIG